MLIELVHMKYISLAPLQGGASNTEGQQADPIGSVISRTIFLEESCDDVSCCTKLQVPPTTSKTLLDVLHAVLGILFSYPFNSAVICS